jgi:hypothetical protein
MEMSWYKCFCITTITVTITIGFCAVVNTSATYPGFSLQWMAILTVFFSNFSQSLDSHLGILT